jgi:hypothetical protein
MLRNFNSEGFCGVSRRPRGAYELYVSTADKLTTQKTRFF